MGIEEKARLVYAVTASVSTNFFRGRLKYLKERGFDVHLVSSPGKELEERGRQEGITIHSLPMRREISLANDFVSLLRAYLLIHRLKPDIVDAITPKAGLLFSIAAFLCRVPCRIYSLYGLRLETTKGVLRNLLSWLEHISCACVHKVVCVSPSLKQKVIELKITHPEKLVVIGSGGAKGVPVERFVLTPQVQAQVEYLRQKLGLTSTPRLCHSEGAQRVEEFLNLVPTQSHRSGYASNPPVIGFVGRLVRDKGIKELVEAYFLLKPRFPSLRLLLVGPFEDGDPVDPETRHLIETTPGIIVTGRVNDAVPYYYLMDVLVLPTYREGFPSVPLEAAAAGKPVVTTDATGAIDSVVDGVTGYIVPKGNAMALADAIARLLENPELAKRMGEAGRKRVIAEFQPERIWQGVEKLYRELLSEKVNFCNKFSESEPLNYEP